VRLSLAAEARYSRRVVTIVALAILPFLGSFFDPSAASQYTSKQLEAYNGYTGKTYWVVGEANKIPAFLSAPSPTAPTFTPALNESFEIKDIVADNPSSAYYRAIFVSGKEGFIPIVAFIEQVNASFTSVDPDRNARAKAAKETHDEEKRREWIQSQRWPEHVKQAALAKQPALGMNTREASAILGKPKSVVPLKSANFLMGRQEQWVYENGPVLTFSNGIVTRIQPREETSK
jgi:hypothetical protein